MKLAFSGWCALTMCLAFCAGCSTPVAERAVSFRVLDADSSNAVQNVMIEQRVRQEMPGQGGASFARITEVELSQETDSNGLVTVSNVNTSDGYNALILEKNQYRTAAFVLGPGAKTAQIINPITNWGRSQEEPLLFNLETFTNNFQFNPNLPVTVSLHHIEGR